MAAALTFRFRNGQDQEWLGHHAQRTGQSALHPPRVGIGGRGMVRVLDSVGDGAHDDGNKHGDRQVFHWPFSNVASCVTDRGFTCSTVKTRTGGAVCGRNRPRICDDLEIKSVSVGCNRLYEPGQRISTRIPLGS